MATTLFDTVNKTLQAKPAAAPTDQTAQVQGLLRAKLGKATAGAGAVPAASNIQEQVAAKQVATQGQQLQQQGAVEAQQLQQQQAGQQVQLAEQRRSLAEQSANQLQRYQLDTDNLLSEFQRGTARLDDQKDNSKAEKLGFNMRLQDKRYLQNLEQSGARERIKDAASFGIEMAESTIGMNRALLKLGLDSKAIANASDREFEEMLGQMGIEEANQLFQDQQNHERRMAPYTAGSAILSAGLNYAANRKTPTADTDTTANTDTFEASPKGPQSTNVTFGGKT